MSLMIHQQLASSGIPCLECSICRPCGNKMALRCRVHQHSSDRLSLPISLQPIRLTSAVLTSSCSRVARLRIVPRSHICARPSVPALTTAAPPGISTNPIASTLSFSVCPASAPTTSPLLRLTTRMPPDSPPTTANVDEGLTPKEVIPPRFNRVLLGPSLKSGVVDLGSQNMRNPSAPAVAIRLPEVKPERRVQWIPGSQLTIWGKFTALDCSSVARKHLHGGS